MPVSSAIYRCSCSRSWVRHSAGHLSPADTCPSCGGSGSRMDAPLAVALSPAAPMPLHPPSLESDDNYRKRLMKVCSVRDRATVLVAGPQELDDVGRRYRVPRL